jgi:tRNA-specific 2-thiouridylase
MTRERLLVAMSGGVDSAAAAALLVEQGHEVVGATLKLWCYGGAEAAARSSCSLRAI